MEGVPKQRQFCASETVSCEITGRNFATNDKTQKLFYNASAYKKESDPELFAFLQFVSTNVPDDDFTDEIFASVEEAKKNEQFRSDYMRCNIHDFDIREEGRTEGIAIGEERGRNEAKLEAARNMLLENIPIEVTARCIGLSAETVRAISEELKFEPV